MTSSFSKAAAVSAVRYERFRVGGSAFWVPGSGFKGSKMVVSDVEILRAKLFHHRETEITEIYFFRLPGDDGKRKLSMLAHNGNLCSNKLCWCNRRGRFFAHRQSPDGQKEKVSLRPLSLCGEKLLKRIDYCNYE